MMKHEEISIAITQPETAALKINMTLMMLHM